VVSGAVIATVACGGPSTGTPASPAAPEIARIHRARCGACHTRVEPGQRTREALKTALSRHRVRVRLTEAQWAEMVDYLAQPASPQTEPR
jgi:hypothetical protein